MALTVTVYNKDGKKVGTETVPESFLGLPSNDDLLYQVYTVKRANQRINYAHTKTRGEVRGGGIKPHPQKGTGRARAGSIRSPLWRGGGVTFGPRNERVYAKNINKKMNKKAIAIALSSKVKDETLYVIDMLSFDEAKTKGAAKFLHNLKKENVSNLVIGTKNDTNFSRVFRNIPKTKAIAVNRINIVDILHNKNCIVSRDALQQLINTYANTDKRTQESGSAKGRAKAIEHKEDRKKASSQRRATVLKTKAPLRAASQKASRK